jgi:hypothetical protein
LPQPGRWRLSTVVIVDNRQLAVETDVEAATALPHLSDLWFWAGWPAIAIGLFAAHRGLVYRSDRRHVTTLFVQGALRRPPSFEAIARPRCPD